MRTTSASAASTEAALLASETALEASQAALRASEERFASAFEHSGIGMALVSPEGKWLRVNRSLSDILGYSQQELLTRTFQDVTHPDDLEKDLANVQLLLNDHIRTYKMEKRYFAKGGRIIWVLLTVSLVRYADGRPLHFISQIEDISDRKQVEASIREAEEKFRAVFTYNPMMTMLVTHPQHRIVEVNDAFLAGFKLRRDEVVGRSTSELEGWFGTEEGASFWQFLRTKGPTDSFESVFRRSDGEVFNGKVNSNSFTLDGGTFYLHSIEDITERNRIRAELMQAKDAAESASRAKSDFLAMMSHEIRTPMNGVFGFINLLSETRLSGEQQDFVDIIKRSGDALLKIINDILDFSKIEAGKLVLESVRFDLRAACEDVLALSIPKAAEKGLELTLEYADDVPTHVTGDPARVRQILLNLIGNAVKFAARGAVRVGVRSTRRDLLKISVTDGGPGISPELQGQLFERFTQADSSTTRNFGGTGLGLAICKKLTELMGGRIGLISEVGVGSTFWFTLGTQPRVAAGPAESTRTAATPFESGPADEDSLGPIARVLLADDNPVNQMLATRLLEKLGCRVDKASNGREAVESLSRLRYDLVLMDCHMPEMDGFEATRIVRRTQSESRRIPIVALTASVTARDREACLTAGMDDFLGKPLIAADLKAVVQKWRATGFDSRHRGGMNGLGSTPETKKQGSPG